MCVLCGLCVLLCSVSSRSMDVACYYDDLLLHVLCHGVPALVVLVCVMLVYLCYCVMLCDVASMSLCVV